MNIKTHSKSGIFLIELLIIIAVFAVCSAICLQVLTMADNELLHSEKLTTATNAAIDMAECFKSGESADSIVERYMMNYDGTIFATQRHSESVNPTFRGVIIAELIQHSENGIDYLDITVKDGDYEYIKITAARLGG
ncbi:MAG: hypothetical protein J1E39_04190 [Eubacterium sp.]|nr:hypothetical protein [Eubacterium sp.]